MNIYTHPSTSTAAEAAGQAVSLLLSNRAKPTLLMVSGGSNLHVLDYIDSSVLDEHITISTLDDRVDPDTTVNNFLQLKSTPFYEQAVQAGCSFINTSLSSALVNYSEGDALTEALAVELASNINLELTRWLQRNPVRCIVATIGMGEDGHIAGIMPYPDNADLFDTYVDTANLMVGSKTAYDIKYPLRITTTIPFISEINHAIAYIVGEPKKNKLQQLIEYPTQEPRTPLHQFPAAILHSIKHVDIYTDIKL